MICLLVMPFQPRSGRPFEDLPQSVHEDKVGDQYSDEQRAAGFDLGDLAEVLRVDRRGLDGERPGRGCKIVVARARRPSLEPGRFYLSGVIGDILEICVVLEECRIVKDVAAVDLAEVGKDRGVEGLCEDVGLGPDIGPCV